MSTYAIILGNKKARRVHYVRHNEHSIRTQSSTIFEQTTTEIEGSVILKKPKLINDLFI